MKSRSDDTRNELSSLDIAIAEFRMTDDGPTVVEILEEIVEMLERILPSSNPNTDIGERRIN